MGDYQIDAADVDRSRDIGRIAETRFSYALNARLGVELRDAQKVLPPVTSHTAPSHQHPAAEEDDVMDRVMMKK